MSEVDKVIGKLNSKLKPLAVMLRKTINTSIPQAQEIVKWGNPCWVMGKRNIAFICSYTSHIDLGFFQGARLQSPLLEGTGKGMRHIKVRSPQDITKNEREISRLLKEAALSK